MSLVTLNEFDEPHLTDWAEAAQKDLGGDDPFERLKWSFEPGLQLAPYYSGANQPSYLPPVAGVTGWNYLSPVYIHGEKPNETALEALQGSEGLIWLAEPNRPYPTAEALLKGVELDYCYNAFELTAWNGESRKFLEALNNAGQLKGFLVYSSELRAYDDGMASCFAEQPGFRPLCHNALRVHENGMPPSAEIAWLLSAFIESAGRVLKGGLSAGQLLSKSVFCVGLGRDYFHEIAKIRALKLTLVQVAKAFGAEEAGTEDVCIFAKPSLRTFSATDPYVNIIRGTAEAMSGVIGGISFLSIPRFDYFHPINTPGFSDRIARNISNLLRSESYMDKISDPAAGSYYIEHLTNELAAKAWEKMQHAESLGGFTKAADEGFWAQVRKELADRERSLVSSRKLNLVGVNNFNDLDIIRDFPSPGAYLRAREKVGVEPLGLRFEQLRLETEEYLQKHQTVERPTVSAVLFGERSKALARYSFIQSFFAVAGIKVGPPVWWQDSEDLVNTAAVVLCSSDEEYTGEGAKIAGRLQRRFPGVAIAVAGSPPKQEELIQSGISTFIHLKSDALEVLTHYQKLFGIV